MSGNGSPEANIDLSLHTKLDPEVQTPWLNTFELGQGIDAVKGHAKVSPFKGIRSLKVLPDSDPPQLESTLKIVHGQYESSIKRRFHAQGTINTHSPLILEASFSRETTRSQLESSFFIEQYVHGEYHFETLDMDDLELTDSARSLLQEAPNKFRDKYGDYFIVGYQRRFMFSALIGCHTSNKQYTKQTEDDAKVAWQGVLGGGVGYTEEHTTSDIRFSGAARVLQSGCDFQTTGPSGDSVALKDVIDMVGGIRRTPPNGRRDIALLRHYSQLFNSLPNSAPVLPRIFDELHELDSIASELEQSRFHPACNWYTILAIEEALMTFTKRRSSFIDEEASLTMSQSAFSKVKELLDARLRRYDLIQWVINESRNSPAIGSKVAASNPNQKWVYGFVGHHLPQAPGLTWKGPNPITLTNGISAYEVMLEATPRLRSAELTFTSTRARLSRRSVEGPSRITLSAWRTYIVGWTLSCQTQIQKEKTFTVKGGGLTHEFLRIEVESVGILEPSTWRCRIYFVSEDND